MPRITSILLLTLVGRTAYADVLDHQHGLAAQLVHQTLGGHHLPYTVLLIVVGVVVYRSWRAARK